MTGLSSSTPTAIPVSVPEDEAFPFVCDHASEFFACGNELEEGPAGVSPEAGRGGEEMDFRCLGFGAEGKLSFLSIVSTVRWKRRKSASARMRVEGRSMVLESSLTSNHKRHYSALAGPGTGALPSPEECPSREGEARHVGKTRRRGSTDRI